MLKSTLLYTLYKLVFCYWFFNAEQTVCKLLLFELGHI